VDSRVKRITHGLLTVVLTRRSTRGQWLSEQQTRGAGGL